MRLKFRPNPNYDPPTRVEQVLTGMQGVVLVDPRKTAHRQNRRHTFSRRLPSDGASSAIWTVAAIFWLIRPTWAMTTGPSAAWNWRSPAKFFCSRASISSRPRVFSDFHPVPAGPDLRPGSELLKKQVATMAENQVAY